MNLPSRLLLAATTLVAASSALAATDTKSATGTDLTAAASWAPGAPTVSDTATWDSTSLGAGLTAATAVNWGSINITGALTNIDITGAGKITTGDITLAGTKTLAIANAIGLSGNAIYTIADATGSVMTDATLSGAITGAFGITKTGAGTLVLTNSGTNYSGATIVNSGILELRDTTGFASAITVNTGGMLRAADTANRSLGAATATITLNGGTYAHNQNFYRTHAGLLTVSADSFITANNIGNTTQQYWDAGVTGAGNLTITNTGNATETGVVFRNAAGSQSLSGVVTVNGGVLGYGASSTALRDAKLELVGATLQMTAVNGISITASNETVGALSGDSASAVVTNNQLTVGGRGDSTTFAGVISGTGSMVKTGAGTFTLSGANTYTGATSISAGTLTLNNSLALQNTIFSGGAGALVFDSSVAAHAFAFGSLSGSTNLALTDNAGSPNAVALTIGNNTTAATYSGALSGAGSLTKIGTGSQTLGGTNTYGGSTTVSSGTLSLDYTTQDNSKLSDTADLVLNGGTLNLVGGSHTELVASTILSGAASVTRTGGTAVLQMNTITHNAGGFVNFGAENIATTDNANDSSGILGAWATVGDNWAVNSTGLADGLITAYTGYTDVIRLTTGGSKVIADGATTNVRIIEGTGAAANITLGSTFTTINTLNQSVSGGAGAATLDLAGKTLAVNGILMASGAGALTIGTAANTGTLMTATAGGELALINNSANTLTINSAIVDNTSASSLTKSGTGKVLLVGTNTYTGSTIINAGTLTITGASSLPSGSAITNNGVLELSVPGTFTFQNNMTGTGSLLTANTVTISGNSIAQGGTGGATFNGNTTFSNTTASFGGTLRNGGNRTLTIQSGSSVSFGDAWLGSQNSGQRSTTTVTGGTLTITGAARDARDAYFDVVQSGGVVNFGSLLSNQTEAGNSGGLSGNSTYTLTGGQFTVGAISGGGGGTFDRGITLNLGGGTLTASRSFTMAANTVNLTGTNGDVTIDTAGFTLGSSYGFSGIGGLNKIGAGILSFTVANTYSGLTKISGGTVLLGHAGALQNTTLDYNNYGGALSFGTLGAATLGGLQGSQNLSLINSSAGAVALSVGNNNASTTYGGVLSGTGSLTKVGTGTLNLTGDNSFAGLTTVNGGVLSLSGSNNTTGATTLGSGTTLRLDYGTNDNRKIGSGALTLSGSTVELTGGTFADSVASTTLTANTGSSVTRTNGGATLNLGAITVNAGARLNLLQSGIARTSNVNVSGILGAWATINNTDWAVNDGSGLIVGVTYAGDVTRLSSGTKSITGAVGSAVRIIEGTGAAGDILLGSAVTTIGSLNQSSTGGAGAAVIDPAGKILEVDNIMVSAGAGGLTIGNGVNNGTLRSSTTALAFRDIPGAGITVNSVIANGTGGASTLTKYDAGTLVLNGVNTYTGGTTIGGGTLQIGGAGQLNSGSYAGAIANNGTLLFSTTANQTLSGIISGTGNLTKTGAGTLTCTALDTYTGALTVAGGGTMIVQTASGTNTFTGSGLNINGASTLRFQAVSTSTRRDVVGKTVTFDTTGGGTLDIASSNLNWVFQNNTIVTNGGARDNITSSGGTGTLNLNLGTLAFNVARGTDATSDLTVSAVFGNTAGAITKSGAGILTLSGANTYTGLMTISGGTLKLGAAGGATNTPLGTTAAGTTVSATGAALDLNGFTLGAAEALTLNGTGVGSGGALTNSSATAATYSGLITLGSASSIVASSGNIILSNAGTITGATFGLTLDGAAMGSSLASIIGTTTGGLTKAGVGTWVLSGANTYTGVTALNGGILSVATLANGGTASGIGASTNAATNLVFAGGTLKYTGATVSTDRAFTLTADSGLEVTNAGTTLTFASAVASAGNSKILTKTGAGTLVLGGAFDNSSLFLSVSTGSVELAKSVALMRAVAGISSVASGATVKLTGTGGDQIYGGSITTNMGVNGLAGTLDLNGLSESTSNFNGVASGKVTNSASATNITWTVGETNATSSFDGVIENGAGMVALSKIGTGTQTLNGVNTYTGGTSIASGGTLVIGTAGSLGSGNYAGNIANVGTFRYSSSANQILSGVISGAGAFTKDTASTSTLTLTGVNTYTGVTKITTGTLSVATIGNGGVAGNLGQATNAAANLVLDGGTLQYTGATASTDRAFTITAAKTGTIEVSTGATALTMSGASAATTGALIKSGAGTLIFTGANAYTGGTTISAGTLQIGSGAVNGTMNGVFTTGSSGTLRYIRTADTTAPTWANVLGSGMFSVMTNRANSGTTNDWGQAALATGFTGTLQIERGRVSTNTETSLGNATAVIVQSGGQLGMWNGGTFAQNFTIAGTGYGETGYDSALRLGNSVATTLGGTMTLSGNATVGGGQTAGGVTTFNGAIGESAGSYALTLGTSSTTLGTYVFNAANTYSGATNLAFGTLRLGNTNALQNSTLSYSTGTLVFDSSVVSNAFTLGGLSGNKAIALQNNAGSPAAIALSVGNNNAATSYSGVLSGAGSLTKVGSGALTLSGNNSYSGGTIVSAGTLTAGHVSAFGSGSVAVNTGGTLNVNGLALANAMTVNGGTLAGGAGSTLSSTVTVGAAGVAIASGANIALNGNLTLATGAITANGTGLVANTAGGTLTLGGSGNLNLGGAFDTYAGGGTYTLITGTFSGHLANASNVSGYSTSVWSNVSFDNNTGNLVFIAAIPEPSTYGLIGAGALASVALVRRRRKLAGKAA